MDQGWQNDGEGETQRRNDRYGGDNRGAPRGQNDGGGGRYADRNTDGGGGRYADRNTDGGGGRYADRNNDGIVVEINPNKVGMVIGRGGAKIREIQEQYNVNVKVDRDTNANGMSSVTIRGTVDDMEKAKAYIEELVVEQANSFGGGGGRGGGGGGGSVTCYNCNETGHMSRECPTKSGGGGGGGYGGGGGGGGYGGGGGGGRRY